MKRMHWWVGSAFLCVVLGASTRPAEAKKQPSNPLLKVKEITCYVQKGTSSMWQGHHLEVRTSKWAKSKKESVLRFKDIDYKQKSAKLEGNQGTDDVWVMATDEGMTFLERTASGGITLSTVFAEHFRWDKNSFPFVHSRHLLLGGVPVPSQYYGYCEITRR